MKVYNQDHETTSPARRHWIKFGAALTAVAVISIGLSIMLAAALGASENECTHTVQPGDTLSSIGREHDVTWQRLAAINQLVNAHLIHPGDTLDVCHDRESQSQSGPVLVPGRLIEWANAVTDTKPVWATDDDVRFLVAVSGPESNHGTHLWNPGDAGGPFTGSYGVVQIRTMANPPAHPATDWYRNRGWLEQSFENQAQAAWIVLQTGRQAWGPHRDGKMPDDCQRSTNVARCAEWWEVADRALANA